MQIFFVMGRFPFSSSYKMKIVGIHLLEFTSFISYKIENNFDDMDMLNLSSLLIKTKHNHHTFNQLWSIISDMSRGISN